MSDGGLFALVAIAQYHQIPADPNQLRHQFGQPGLPFGSVEIIRAARSIGMKAKLVRYSKEKLNRNILPAIALSTKDDFFILAAVKVNQEGGDPSFLIQEIGPNPPRSVSLSELDSLWTGEVILISPRGLFSSAGHRPFNIKWFIPSLVKYRKLFGEVIMASLFLQLFALVTPLFFQVVMDKVLVHKGLTTLDVLAIGFFVVSFFEVVLGGAAHVCFQPHHQPGGRGARGTPVQSPCQSSPCLFRGPSGGPDSGEGARA